MSEADKELEPLYSELGGLHCYWRMRTEALGVLCVWGRSEARYEVLSSGSMLLVSGLSLPWKWWCVVSSLFSPAAERVLREVGKYSSGPVTNGMLMSDRQREWRRWQRALRAFPEEVIEEAFVERGVLVLVTSRDSVLRMPVGASVLAPEARSRQRWLELTANRRAVLGPDGSTWLPLEAVKAAIAASAEAGYEQERSERLVELAPWVAESRQCVGQ